MAKLRSIFHWHWERSLVIGVPYTWLLVFFLIPFLIVLHISVIEMQNAADPFGRLFSYADGFIYLQVKVSNYLFIAQDSLYLTTYLRSIKYALMNTVLCLAIGYPFAYFLARAPEERKPVLLMLVMLPFWTSFLLRIYAWKGILAEQGILNQVLLALRLIQEPLQLMHTPFSLMIGMVYAYLPFMILPLFANLSKMDNRLLEAAADLGARPWTAFWRITVPLSRNGILAGTMLVFIPSVGEYVIPELLGGPETLMIGRTIWDEFFSNNDWPMAAAVTVVIVLLILGPLALFNRYQMQAPSKRTGAA